MANSTLAALTASGALTGTELFYSDNGAQDVKVTANQLKAFIVGTGSVSVASGKTLTVANTLTLAGADGATLNIGGGGSLGTAAFVNTGTSGGTVPLLNVGNTWSGGTQVFNAGASLGSAQTLDWNGDTILVRDGVANTLALRNGTNPQNFNAYNSYTNASNNEGFQISWFSNALFLNTFKNGTGSGRPIHIQPANSDLFLGTADYWKISPSSSPAGNLLAVTDNSVDIGSNGANRPRNYFGSGTMSILGSTAIPAGGAAGSGYVFSSTSNYGIFFGSGAPTLSAAKGSLYLRSDGTTTNDRAYINTNGSTTWTALTTAA
jgi:hypothetical protein